MTDHDDGFIPHFDLERELYTAMAEETNGLGPPELDMDRVYNAGRRRRTVVVGATAGAVLIGATAVAVVAGFGGSGGGGSGTTSVAAGTATSATPVPTGSPTSPSIPVSSPTQCDYMPVMSLPPQFASSSGKVAPSAPAFSGKAETGMPSNVTVSTAPVTGAPSCPLVVQILPYTDGSGHTAFHLEITPGGPAYTLVPPSGTSSAPTSAVSSR